MKKLFNKLSSSGKIDVDTLREDTYSDEEHLDAHYRKSSSLPADVKDTSQDIKAKKSFSGSGGVSRTGSGSVGKASKDYDFAKKKSSSSGIKAQNKDKDKEKLNESDDKALRKSSSRKKSMSKSGEVKDPDCMKSPALKSVFVSEYEQRDASLESDESSDDEFPRSRGNSLHDDEREYSTTTPIRVPSAPARMASSPVPAHTPSPTRMASPTQAMSPRMDSPPKSFTASPPQAVYSPQVHYGASSPAQPSVLPRSVSSPNPASKPVVLADDFDLRFGGAESGRVRTDSISDDYEKLGKNFSRDRADSAADDVEAGNGEATNQKGKSGLFSFGNNKAKKLK